MILDIYILLLIFAFLMLGLAVLLNVQMGVKSVFVLISTGLFAILALSSFNVTKVFVNSNGTSMHIVQFQTWDATALAWLNLMFFFISLILLIVFVLSTFQEVTEPKWKGKLRDSNEGR